MAALKAYCDDSRSGNDRFFVIGGMSASEDAWRSFQTSWNEILDRFCVPYLHIREYAGSSPRTPFAKWANRDKKDERREFLAALTNLVCNDEFTIISAALCVDDLLRFNRQHGLNVAPYSVCLAAIKIKAGIVGSPQLIVDNFDGCSTLLSQADICLKAHEAFRNLPMSIVSRAAPCRANCMPALQAADLIAWEVRRYWDTGYDKNVSTGEFAPRKVFDRLAKESANATCRIESDDLDNYYSRCNRQLLADTFAVR